MNDFLSKLWADVRSQPGMDEPLVRWGLVIIFLIIFWFFIASPYLDWRGMRQSSIDMQAQKAAKTQALKASSDIWKASLSAHSKHMQSLTHALLSGSSYAGAQAFLLKMIVGMLQTHHLSLDSQRLLDVSIEKDLGQRVGVFLRAHGSKHDVLSFIDAVSTADTLLILDKLYVGHGQSSDDIMLQFQVTGFRLVSESP